ncbi:myogenesis-regulating glycosidase-like isoform X2 [Mytilus californianus]|uniref:myogenesis-regulating glycosidase-like isoform X2 n=1 Tax=Mytilus californianus TaxID=6549 RepID=UPI0022471A15|nr:myogenesis-regulating glycosidase-like isoform X2 [Mytilus californianus]
MKCNKDVINDIIDMITPYIIFVNKILLYVTSLPGKLRIMKKYKKNIANERTGNSYIVKKMLHQCDQDIISFEQETNNSPEDPADSEKTSIKRRILKVAVTIMFLVMAVGVIVIWSLHDGGKENKQAKFIFFHANDLYLKIDTGHEDQTSLAGSIGGDLFVVPGSDERGIDKCKSDAKWCFTWKEKTVLTVDYVKRELMGCMDISWQNITSIFPTDCYELKMGYWFGMGGNEKWIANNNPLTEDYYLPGYDKQHGNVYEFYLLSSYGTSFYIVSEDPFRLRLNETDDTKLCISPVPVGPRMYTSLEYSICQGDSIQNTHTGASLMSHRQSTGSNKVNITPYERFSWSVGNADELLNVTKVTDFIEKLKKRGYQCGEIEIDFKWEIFEGDFEFDSNIKNTLNILKNHDCQFILPISPVVSYMSKLFDYGVKNELFVKDLYQNTVRLYNYGDIQGALLDMSVENTRDIMKEKLKSLANIINISSFKLKKIPVSVHTAAGNGGKFSVSGIFRGWINVIESLGKIHILENVYRAQDKSVLIEVGSSISHNTLNQSCLSNPLPTVFTLGIDGYPYLLSTVSKNNLTSELFIRWLQYSAFFTGLTLPSDTLFMRNGTRVFVTKVKKFRDGFVSQIIRSLQPDVSPSQPILLPLWWHYSSDEKVFAIEDQFLFNETILIAPVFCAGQITRDIYLPAIDGIWSHQPTGKNYNGNKWIRNFNVGLDGIPYFKAKNVY